MDCEQRIKIERKIYTHTHPRYAERPKKKIKVTLRIFGESSSYRDSRLFALI